MGWDYRNVLLHLRRRKKAVPIVAGAWPRRDPKLPVEDEDFKGDDGSGISELPSVRHLSKSDWNTLRIIKQKFRTKNYQGNCSIPGGYRNSTFFRVMKMLKALKAAPTPH